MGNTQQAYTELLELRTRLRAENASPTGKEPKICPDESLMDMAVRLPAKRNDLLMIKGIGETFAANYFGVTPDIICLGKSFGAGLPLAGIIISDKLKGFEPDSEELHTFANPTLSMACACKQLEMFDNGVLANGRAMGQYLGDKLKELQKTYPQIGDVRQVGMHIGVEIVDEKIQPRPDKAAEIRKNGFKHGLILGTGGVRKNVLKVKPPLIINQAECDEVIEKFKTALSEVF